MTSFIHMSFFTDSMVIAIIKREMHYDNIWLRYTLYHEEKTPYLDYGEKLMVKNEFNHLLDRILNQYIC